MLAVRRFGEGRPVIALHGFTLTGRQFADLPDLIDRAIIAPDLPGHGDSATAATDFNDVLDAIASLVGDHPGVPVIGYSQGARLALSVATLTNAPIGALVVVSGTAGIAEDGDRRSRAAEDASLAHDLVSEGLDAFLDDWLEHGVTSTTHRDEGHRTSDRALREENTAVGLAAALRGYGQGSQPPLWDRLPDLRTPTLVITGESDPKYSQIGGLLAAAIPMASHASIRGAGHNPLADQPVATGAALSAFLDRLG